MKLAIISDVHADVHALRDALAPRSRDGDIVSQPHEPTPTLTPLVVTNDQALAAAVDAVIQADETDRGHRRNIGRLQAELRRRVGDDIWEVFLQLDEAGGARLADLTVMLVTWAFVEGQRDAGRGHGGGR